ncbi:MAG: LuxR C-terminal-related transcriptional regulator [Bacteroidetes bacterium]|nr:LuxR C-terminal-related transcriptional regulator [Bacteroidota bacterium]
MSEKETKNPTDSIMLLDKLTSRQKQVMLMVIKGYRSKEIAKKLGIAVRTVEQHRYMSLKVTESQNSLHFAQKVNEGE